MGLAGPLWAFLSLWLGGGCCGGGDLFFLIFSFDLSFDFDCTLAGQGDFRRILQVAALAFLRAIYVCKIIAYHTTI